MAREEEDIVMVIDKPHFIVKLHKALLEVDLKEGVRKKLEDVLEANPTLRGSLGFLFQNVVPLDVPLKDIESAELDEKQRVKIIIPHRKNITIPLEKDESEKLVDKLNELVPMEKQREMERVLRSARETKEFAREIDEEKARAISESRQDTWKAGGPI
jgi:hypothetical protein